MAEKKSKLAQGGSPRDDSSLDTLSRTLEELELRLTQMSSAKAAPRPVADVAAEPAAAPRTATRLKSVANAA